MAQRRTIEPLADATQTVRERPESGLPRYAAGRSSRKLRMTPGDCRPPLAREASPEESHVGRLGFLDKLARRRDHPYRRVPPAAHREPGTGDTRVGALVRLLWGRRGHAVLRHQRLFVVPHDAWARTDRRAARELLRQAGAADRPAVLRGAGLYRLCRAPEWRRLAVTRDVARQSLVPVQPGPGGSGQSGVRWLDARRRDAVLRVLPLARPLSARHVAPARGVAGQSGCLSRVPRTARTAGDSRQSSPRATAC